MKSTKEKIILDLCGGTGAWSEPYRKAGYSVHVITLPFDVTMWYVNDRGYIEFPNSEDVFHRYCIEISKIYGILAAPPCTQFSFARQRYKTPPDFKNALKAVNACMEIIQYCKLNSPLEFWALENPTGHLRKFLGRPPTRFFQWQYGGYHVKPTDLWGWFNEPTPTHRKKPNISAYERMKRWSNPKIPAQFENLKSTKEKRAAVRAITPAGFASAFFKANR